VSRGGSRGDRPESGLTQPLAARSTGVDHLARNSSAKPAERRPGARLEADPRPASELDRVRKTVFLRERRYRISKAEQALLTTVGAFRAVAVKDLLTYQYPLNHRLFGQDLRSLKGQGLVRRHRLMVGGVDQVLEVLVLTREAKALLASVGREDGRQVCYVGLVKPREVAHDAAIYRMYEAEAAQIKTRGGVVRRVVLDYELKASIYAALAKARSLPRLAYAKRQREVAQTNGLQVVGGRIPLPDLRLEYQTAEGDLTKVDLDLATHHYHGAYALEKARVGFKLYADGSSAARLNARLTQGRGPVPDGPGLTDAILAL
jgi:hypothetical protein